MIVVFEIDRNSDLKKLGISYETLYRRLCNNLKKEEIESCGDRGYYAMMHSDLQPKTWYLLIYNKGKVPRSVQRACDDRCILSDDGITWIRRTNEAMWENLGKLYSHKSK